MVGGRNADAGHRPAASVPGAVAAFRASAPLRPTRVDSSATTQLIVDDDEANRDMLARRLQRLGYGVVLAEHGDVSPAHLAEQAFDLILLDIDMPELDCYEVLRRLKAATRCGMCLC